MGMTGIDGTHALLKNVRADLSANRKKLTDKDSSLSQADAAYLEALKLGYSPNLMFATV